MLEAKAFYSYHQHSWWFIHAKANNKIEQAKMLARLSPTLWGHSMPSPAVGYFLLGLLFYAHLATGPLLASSPLQVI